MSIRRSPCAPRGARPDARGFSLIELLVVLLLVSMMALITVPPLLSASARLRVDLAARELSGILNRARSLAVLHSVHVGVRFHDERAAGRVTWACYRDGDADGVRNADIRSGVDTRITPVQQMLYVGGRVGFGFPPGQRPRDPGDPSRRLSGLDDPIRFNASDLASFDPLGGSTPGSLYLTDGRRELSVVRLWGRTGKVRILRWDVDADAWR
jgi:prepilin-type N-terminal cleavage/methylation domain-containing protein